MHRIVVATLGVISLLACGPTNSFSGSVQGQMMQPKEAIYAVQTLSGGGQAFTMIISDQTGLCNLYTSGHQPKSATAMGFIAEVLDSSGSTTLNLATGAYTVVSVGAGGSGNLALSFFDKVDSTCNSLLSGQQSATGTGGTFTLNAFSASNNGNANGSFNVNFGSDHASGTFNATACAALNASTSYTCQ